MGLLDHGGLLLATQTMSLHAHWPEASGASAHGHRTFVNGDALPAVALLLRAFTGTVPMGQQCSRLCGEDGLWRKPEVHVTELGGAEVPSKVCPACARRVHARAACLGQPDATQVEPESPSDGPHPQEAHA
jgi:hypothetical protein